MDWSKLTRVRTETVTTLPPPTVVGGAQALRLALAATKPQAESRLDDFVPSLPRELKCTRISTLLYMAQLLLF